MSDLDLNLLRVFDALFDLRSVTRAAARLNLTQSAVSHALARLRGTLGDPLFVRSGRGLQPTARANEIAPGLRDGFDRLRLALSPHAFDPVRSERAFTISAGTYFCALTMPPLLAAVRAAAPGVSIRLRAPTANVTAELEEGGTDIALGAFGQLPGRFSTCGLYIETLVWIAARGHRLLRDRMEPARLALEPRLQVVSGRPFETGPTMQQPAAEPVAVSYDPLSAVLIVGATDLIALVPRRFAMRYAARNGAALLDVSGEPERVAISMAWHHRATADPSLSWLREQIRQVTAKAGLEEDQAGDHA